MAVRLAVAGDVFGSVLLRAVPFPHEMFWMRSGTELSQFLRIFPTYFWYTGRILKHRHTLSL